MRIPRHGDFGFGQQGEPPPQTADVVDDNRLLWSIMNER